MLPRSKSEKRKAIGPASSSTLRPRAFYVPDGLGLQIGVEEVVEEDVSSCDTFESTSLWRAEAIVNGARVVGPTRKLQSEARGDVEAARVAATREGCATDSMAAKLVQLREAAAAAPHHGHPHHHTTHLE